MTEQLSDYQLDLLKEIINIGGGHAATSIAQMVDRRIDMGLPLTKKMSFTEVFQSSLPEEAIVKAIFIEVTGAAEGMFLCAMEGGEAERIIAMVMNGRPADREMATSALSEFVNILANSYLMAVAQFLEIQVQTSVPVIVEDMFGALLTSAYLEEYQFDDHILVIKNEFFNTMEKMEFSLYFIPRAGMMNVLLDKISY